MPRYYKVCPRGFANEVTYYRINSEQDAAEAEREYGDLSDRNPGAYAEWTTDKRATAPGVAVDWADRHYA